MMNQQGQQGQTGQQGQSGQQNGEQGRRWKMRQPVSDIHPEGTFIASITKFTEMGLQEKYGIKMEVGFFDLQTANQRRDGSLYFPLRAYVDDQCGERSRTTRFRNAVAGRTLSAHELEFEFDPYALVGKSVMVSVVHKPDRSGVMRARMGEAMALPDNVVAGPQPQAQPQAGAPAPAPEPVGSESAGSELPPTEVYDSDDDAPF